MVSSFQRLCWLVVTVVLALGSPLVANSGMINTQLLNTDTTFANAIFENAFTDSPGVHAGGNVLGGFLRHDIGPVLLGNRAGNSISDELMALRAKENCDHCCSLNLGSMDFTLGLGLPLIFPQAATINPENPPLNLSFNENQPVSFPYSSTGRFKLGLRAIATICQQRWEWSTHQSGSDSAARYQRLAIARTSAGNVRFNYGLG
jgi:hypothetical protein